MRKYWGTLALVALFAAALVVMPSRRQAADAGVSCSLPFNLTNGTTADASQVMANYNAILSCLLNNTAASGANNDITSLSGLTTPLSPTQGGSAYFIGGTTAGTNTMTLANPSPLGFAYLTGYVVTFTVGSSNTGAATINVNSLGAKNIYKRSLSGPIALTGGELVATQQYAAIYDGTQFEITPPLNPIAIGNISQTAPPYGFTGPINLQLNATVGSSLLTVAVKAADTGNDPSATDPVLIPIRSTTASSGAPVWVAITSALSINTNATGATLGCQNAVPCRFWIEGFYNSGAITLALWQSGAGSASPSINQLNEAQPVSTVAMSGGATSAGVFYTPNGTTLTTQPFRILGYVETTEATAGTYATAPSKVQLFGPGIKKPGDVVQTIPPFSTSGTTSCNANTFTVETAVHTTITPTSAANLVVVRALTAVTTSGTFNNGSAGSEYQLSRGTSPTLIGNVAGFGTGGSQTGGSTTGSVSLYALDQPATSASQTYAVYCRFFLSNGTTFTDQGGTMFIDEIMGSLEPARRLAPQNDNLTPLSKVG